MFNRKNMHSKQFSRAKNGPYKKKHFHSKTRHDRLLRFDPNSKAGKVAGGPDSLDKYGVWVVIVTLLKTNGWRVPKWWALEKVTGPFKYGNFWYLY